MTLRESCNLVLAFARVLFVNGQVTGQTASAVTRLGRALGMRVEFMPRWGEVQLQLVGDECNVLSAVANPTGVDMYRVSAAMRAIEEIEGGRLTADAAVTAIDRIGRAPPSPTWLFVLAAAAGAVALAVIYGVARPVPLALISLSAAGGAIARRLLSRRTANMFTHAFCAAFLAGIVGALAVRYGLSSSLRLVALCPCMVLVPGPHLLNSAADLLGGRVHLGAARLIYALLVIAAIATGMLLGLALLGASLPADPIGRSVPLWQDTIAAGIAVTAYGVFFSTPVRMLWWSVAVGTLAHALHWAALNVFGMDVATGALVACSVVGLILSLVSRRLHMPFAAIAFASVVSMMPGVYLLKMTSGLVQIAKGTETSVALLSATAANGITAVIVVLAMSLGLVIPKILVDYYYEGNA